MKLFILLFLSVCLCIVPVLSCTTVYYCFFKKNYKKIDTVSRVRRLQTVGYRLAIEVLDLSRLTVTLSVVGLSHEADTKLHSVVRLLMLFSERE